MSERTVLALGFFDGIHLGHAALLHRAVEMALINKITQKNRQEKPVPRGRSVDELMERLSLLKN